MSKQKRKPVPPSLQAWIQARSRHHLSHAHLQMARELGMNPKKLGSIDNHHQEPWKAPLPQFIEDLYLKRFNRERPELVVPVEQRAQELEKKKRERKEKKKAARETAAASGVENAVSDEESDQLAPRDPRRGGRFQAVSEDDATALLKARTRRVTLVLEAIYAEREHARAGDEPMSAPFQGNDLIYGNAHVTVGDWLTEAISSGATALARRETIVGGSGQLQDRIKYAHFTTLSGLSTIGALEALAAQVGEPSLGDRQWVMNSAAREGIESWEEIRDERNGLQYAIASWLAGALQAYVSALERGVEVEPMEIAKRLVQALAWTATDLALSEDEIT
jgi:hypothetical protein